MEVKIAKCPKRGRRRIIGVSDVTFVRIISGVKSHIYTRYHQLRQLRHHPGTTRCCKIENEKYTWQLF
jgi:hypothetical protein